MRTENQIAASRANGAKSRGPRHTNRNSNLETNPEANSTTSPEANPPKFKASHRALADVVVHPAESRKAFLKLCVYLEAQFAPENAVEDLIVGRIAVAHWRQLRFWRRERDAARLAALQAPQRTDLAASTQPEPQSETIVSVPEPAPSPKPSAPSTSPQPSLDPLTEHRLDTAFFRAVCVFYRVRQYRANPNSGKAEKSPEKSAKLLKQLRKLHLIHPTGNRKRTQENPENSTNPTFSLPPELIAECLEIPTSPNPDPPKPDPRNPASQNHPPEPEAPELSIEPARLL